MKLSAPLYGVLLLGATSYAGVGAFAALAQEQAEHRAPEASGIVAGAAELRGGFLMCQYGTVWAQLDTLTAPNTAELRQQAIEAGYCRAAKSGEDVEVFPEAWRFEAPGIVDPERGVKVILTDELAAQGKAAGWWINWIALEAKG